MKYYCGVFASEEGESYLLVLDTEGGLLEEAITLLKKVRDMAFGRVPLFRAQFWASKNVKVYNVEEVSECLPCLESQDVEEFRERLGAPDKWRPVPKWLNLPYPLNTNMCFMGVTQTSVRWEAVVSCTGHTVDSVPIGLTELNEMKENQYAKLV